LHEHGEGEPVNLGPDARQALIGEGDAVDVGEHHNADGADRARPLELAITASSYSQGSEAKYLMRLGAAALALVISSFIAAAVATLTSRPPKYTFGLARETTATSTPAASMSRMRAS
jgi:hypothetical protein